MKCKTEIEYLGGITDHLGRCRFFLNWTTETGKRRSQVFFDNPQRYGHLPPVKNDKPAPKHKSQRMETTGRCQALGN